MSILDSAAEVASFLEEQGIAYAIIGGLAVQYWGEARSTRDVDVLVLVDPERTHGFLQLAARRFTPRFSDAVSFAQTNRVLLIADAHGTPVDISLGIPGYEEEALSHAVTVTLPNQKTVRLISAEDLIVHKCVAGRPRDVEDIERILVRQKLAIDSDYIRYWLSQFREIIEDRDVAEMFENALQEAGIQLNGS
jgi:predicted nucleotidyltransferase